VNKALFAPDLTTVCRHDLDKKEVATYPIAFGWVSGRRKEKTLVGANAKSVVVVDRRTAKVVRELEPVENKDRGTIRQMMYSPDGTRLAVLREKTMNVWDVATGKRVGEVTKMGGLTLVSGDHRPFLTPAPAWACLSEDGSRLATGTYDDKERLKPVSIAGVWDVATGKLLTKYEADARRNESEEGFGARSNFVPFRPGDKYLLDGIAVLGIGPNPGYYDIWRYEAAKIEKKP
jgi:hypothetical protein